MGIIIPPNRVVNNGIVDVGDTVTAGGVLSVTNAGATNNTVVFANGLEQVGGGNTALPALAVGTTLTATDFFGGPSGPAVQAVGNLGIASATTVNLGTLQAVFGGGSAIATKVNVGGVVQVNIGGATTGVTVSAGGSELVFAGGVASGTTLSGTGAGLQAANLFVADPLNPGEAARTSGTIVNNFGIEQVFNTGSAFGTVVNSGGNQLINNGFAVGTLVNVGGGQLVFNGGGNSGTTLMGGSQVLGQNGPGFNTATTINASGTASGTVVVFRGRATGDIVNGGTLVDWGMGTNPLDGTNFMGSSNANTVNSGGFIFDTGPMALDEASTLNGGGMFVQNGALASGTIVNSGSVLVVGNGSGTSTERAGVISRGGTENVNSGGLDIATVVQGTENVAAGGTARDVSVLAGGIQSVFAGGVASNTAIDGGAVAIASGGGTVGNVTFTQRGGQLILNFSQGFTGPIAGFASPPGVTEQIDLKDIQFSAKATVKFTQTGTSGTLTVTDTMRTANLTLLGTYSTAMFTLSGDGAGGTLVKDPAVAASATTLASHA
jgi:autotransporter passenger strand-loop-strand repeat protein